jgi:hypothetical protein
MCSYVNYMSYVVKFSHHIVHIGHINTQSGGLIGN